MINVNLYDIVDRVPGFSASKRKEFETALYECVNTIDIFALCSQYDVTISQDEARELALLLLYMRRSRH